jgi:hypothetical protein
VGRHTRCAVKKNLKREKKTAFAKKEEADFSQLKTD